ncbi:MAG: aspartate aminotransferase family protein [Firmicutes bacterium]|nr:aspartate aminotransferase family protein [Bacillota bacterium]
MIKDLLTLDEALKLNRKQVRQHYENYINPGLANLLGLLDFDKQFVRAQGVSVWDSDGHEYLDFLGGYGSLNIGHNHPRVIEALEKVRSVPNFLQASMGTLASALAYNLAQITPGDLGRSFFGNSGAEAVEGALKLARAATKKPRIIYVEGSFHGKTYGALSVTGRAKYQTAFGPLVPGTEVVPFGDLAALEEKLRSRDVAAFIVEPIQGEGGVKVPPEGYLKAALELCHRHDALLILDEIQTGFGRTGRMFAAEFEDVVPDVMCLAKSLGGGIMPIGAYIARPEVWDRAYGGIDRAILHTSTFGGNSWAAAAGLAAIEVIIKENLPAEAARKGDYFLGKLRDLGARFPLIKEVRGRGLLIGVEFEKPAKGWMDRLTGGAVNKLSEEYLGAMVAGELQNRHRIITAYTLNNPNVIRLEPPLTVTYEQIDQVVEALEDIFTRNKGLLSFTLSTARTAVGSMLRR